MTHPKLSEIEGRAPIKMKSGHSKFEIGLAQKFRIFVPVWGFARYILLHKEIVNFESCLNEFSIIQDWQQIVIIIFLFQNFKIQLY
jgi:hypothetical protein